MLVIPDGADLGELAIKFAFATGQKSYVPQAAIVNYYHHDSTLCGHQDDAEFTFEHPIVSVSIGNTAVFLIGGTSRDEEPVAMYLRSGDVVVMGGSCRLSYHGKVSLWSDTEGVPRIIRGTVPSQLLPENIEDIKLKPLAEYLKNSRLNINVRQVEPKQNS